jgi:hypothetical protein
MPSRGFVVAMAAQVTLAPYERPFAPLRTLRQWIIVSRCGPEAEFLTVSHTKVPVADGEDAPIGLTPASTAIGILSSEAADDSTFLLTRQQPVMSIAGTFFPADGCVRVAGIERALHLQGEGRHAHSVGRVGAQMIRKDVPYPAPRARGALAWRIDAVRRAWPGEFLA